MSKTYQLFNKETSKKFNATEAGMKAIMGDKHLSKNIELLGEIVNGELVTSSAKDFIENSQTLNISKNGKAKSEQSTEPTKESTESGNTTDESGNETGKQDGGNGETEQENKVNDSGGEQDESTKGQGDGNTGVAKDTTEDGTESGKSTAKGTGKNTNSSKKES